MLAFALLALAAACGAGPVRAPPQMSGEVIAFGGGPSGAHNACFTCHGLEGEGSGFAPRLAGLDAGYLAKQLDDYAREFRPDDEMTPIAKQMSDADRRAVSLYYASLRYEAPAITAPPPAIYLHGDLSRGVLACARCHGDNAAGRGPGYPAIHAQPAEYTAEQLRRWRRGKRRNDGADIMGRIARGLSEQEIEALADYLERGG
ncbi:c-type cytochrome [Vitreimonas sp.]|uniref:c-type cytochrome n=1 Tax=Vitreimonas sp. TaxID=3069702 RepID=UPI002D78B9B0|nr:c-type cytochrome [Vitreimonas sp.]